MELDDMKRRVKYYCMLQTLVHVIVFGNRFYNGTVGAVDEDGIQFHDRFLGSFPISFSQIKHIEPYRGPATSEMVIP